MNYTCVVMRYFEAISKQNSDVTHRYTAMRVIIRSSYLALKNAKK